MTDPKPQPEIPADHYQEQKYCCSSCAQKRRCHVCDDVTTLACSDCAIDLSAVVYVCKKKECRDSHETKCPHNLKQEVAALTAKLEAADKSRVEQDRLFTEAQQKESQGIAELRQQLADSDLAFQHAQEVNGKLEAENAALRTILTSAGYTPAPSGNGWIPPVNAIAAKYWKLRSAVEKFFEVWPEAEKQINQFIGFGWTHSMKYTGPNLDTELSAMREAAEVASRLASPEAGKEGE